MAAITFNSFSQLKKFASGKNWFVQLANGYHIPVTKKDVKRVADSMDNNKQVFKGEFEAHGEHNVQILIY